MSDVAGAALPEGKGAHGWPAAAAPTGVSDACATGEGAVKEAPTQPGVAGPVVHLRVAGAVAEGFVQSGKMADGKPHCPSISNVPGGAATCAAVALL